MTSWKWLVLSAALLSLAVWQPAQAGSAPSNPTLIVADKAVDPADEEIGQMPDSAKQGLWCIGGAAASMSAAYAIGPSEIIMMVTGAMHVPSSGPLVFLPLFSLLAGGTCALAAAAEPAFVWAGDQSGNIAAKIGEEFASLGHSLTGQPAQYADAGANDAGKSTVTITPMKDGEIMSAGCVAGAVGGLLGSMASSPMEIVMLAAGGITVASSTPILAMGLLGTIVAGGCGVGNYALLPVVKLFQNFAGSGSGGHGQAENTGGDVNKLADAVGRSLSALRAGAVEMADRDAVAH